MDLRDLECFVAIAESGSIAAASQRLNRVQSGLSTRLKHLEEDLGVELFERQGRRLALNAQGIRFLDSARDLLQRAERALHSLQEMVPAGKFRLGSMEATAATRLPTILNGFHKQFPTVNLELKVLPSWHSVEALQQDALDAALVSGDVELPAGLRRMPIFREQLWLVSATQHRPIRAPQDLETAALLVFNRGCAYRRRIERWAHEAPQLSLIEIGSYHALLGCVAAGMGVGLVPRTLLDTYAQRSCLRLHRLPANVAQDTTDLVWRGNPDANIQALLDLLPRA